jgi:cysteinyl-tRNA synthetase
MIFGGGNDVQHRTFQCSHGSTSKGCLHLFDSLSQTVQTLPPSLSHHSSSETKEEWDPSSKIPSSNHQRQRGLAWYTCGPTTYAPAHMGHARTYVCIDIIRRVLESQHRMQMSPEASSHAPLFVMNITDVDDKILAAAAAAAAETENSEGNDPSDSRSSSNPAIALARHYEAEFWKDLEALNCLRPHIVTRVSEHVESDIVPYIQQLFDNGMAYEGADGVYFSVQAFNQKLNPLTKYGKLAPATAAAVEAASAFNQPQEHETQKLDPRDFVLWKRRKPEEELFWPSPWGEGRPGWHIECSAMIESLQKRLHKSHQFLVHAGGIDLKFPHHTNEIAQAEAHGSTSQWIPHWVHTGHLHIDGLKMSKSLKNFISIQEFLATDFNHPVDSDEEKSPLHLLHSLESPADDFRLWCLGLSGSYRGSATFSKKSIAEARSIRQKLVRFLMAGEAWIVQVNASSSAPKKWQDRDYQLFDATHEAQQKAVDALSNDLDGSTFVKELVRIAALGTDHIAHQVSSSTFAPVEPLHSALATIRSLLSLVGFSERTTRVSLSHSDSKALSQIQGGTFPSLVEELVRFRSEVRLLALDNTRSNAASDNMEEILSLCDDLRDSILPEMGIELLDGKVDDDDSSSLTLAKSWRYSLPKYSKASTTEEADDSSDSSTGGTTTVKESMSPVSWNDYFRVGQYKGKFLQLTVDGVPITNADGSEVSKRLLKKLLKKREAYMKRLETSRQSSKA